METNDILETIMSLKPYYHPDPQLYEIGVDEAGRGPMFGRVYAAAVVLPKDPFHFDHSLMKDSKKFHSKKKLHQAYETIKTNAVAWSVAYSDESLIDHLNILQATQDAMHRAIAETEAKLPATVSHENKIILVDGNYFKPFTKFNKETQRIESVPSVCVTGGDNTFASIAAASILAKVERDEYISDMCQLHPELQEKYDLENNKGYGTQKHMQGLRDHGLSPWHRKSFKVKPPSFSDA